MTDNSSNSNGSESNDGIGLQLSTKSLIIATIDDLSKINNEIKSKTFIIGSNEWFIKINTNNTKDESLKVSLHLSNSNKYMIRAKVRGFIKLYNSECNLTNYSIHDIKRFQALVFNQFQKKFFLKENINSAKQIGFEIEVIDSYDNNQNKSFEFAKFMNNKSFSDFKFIVGRKEYFVHKIVLSLRSTVFEAMFENDMKEKTTNEAVIEDIDCDLFEEFLNFIYLGKFDKLEKMAEELLRVSDKYNVIELKNICDNFISSEITVKNAIKTAIIGDKYSAEKSKNNAIKCIIDNMDVIRAESKTDWLEFIRLNNHLADEIMAKMNNNEESFENIKKKRFKSRENESKVAIEEVLRFFEMESYRRSIGLLSVSNTVSHQ